MIDINTPTEVTEAYGIIKVGVIILGMWLAASVSACGFAVGGPAGTVIGSTSYLAEVNRGAVALNEAPERVVDKRKYNK